MNILNIGRTLKTVSDVAEKEGYRWFPDVLRMKDSSDEIIFKYSDREVYDFLTKRQYPLNRLDLFCCLFLLRCVIISMINFTNLRAFITYIKGKKDKGLFEFIFIDEYVNSINISRYKGKIDLKEVVYYLSLAAERELHRNIRKISVLPDSYMFFKSEKWLALKLKASFILRHKFNLVLYEFNPMVLSQDGTDNYKKIEEYFKICVGIQNMCAEAIRYVGDTPPHTLPAKL